MVKLIDKVSLYDFFGYFIPGIFVTLAIYDFLHDIVEYSPILPISNEVLKVTLIFIICYCAGVLTHEISELIQKYVMKKIWRGLPSERFLNDKDKKYTKEFKSRLKSAIKEEFNIEASNIDVKQNEEIFNLVYSKVQKLDGKDRIQLFNTLSGFYRNLFAVTAICFVLYATKVIIYYGTNNFTNDATVAIMCLFALLILLRRCKRFQERFTDYVYRDFYYYYISKEEKKC